MNVAKKFVRTRRSAAARKPSRPESTTTRKRSPWIRKMLPQETSKRVAKKFVRVRRRAVAIKPSLPKSTTEDPTKAFPEGTFVREDQVEPYTSCSKLRGDDVAIVRNLIDKYDDDFGAMARDIKTNFMQWSKGECRKMHKKFYAHGMDKK